MNIRVELRSHAFAALLVLYFLFSGFARCQDATTKKPDEVTISDLSEEPQKFDGRLVRVQGLLVLGWEGDNFMSDPRPQKQASREPAYVWFYCKPEYEREVYGAFAARRSINGSFTGYFHFVPGTHIVSGAFDPGSLQFEGIEVSLPETQPVSLSEAVRNGDLADTRRILRTRPHLNVRDEYQSFPLIHAIQGGYADIVDALLAAGADPKIALGGDTALSLAAWGRNLRIAKALLDHGASEKASNALMMAPYNGSDGMMVQLLLDAGADPNAKTAKGMTPLIVAARVGDGVAAEKLLKADADPTVKDSYGNTAESESCDRGEKGHFRVCELVRDALRKR